MKILVNEKLSQHKFKTPEGYLICTDAILARTGKQEYTRKEVFGDSAEKGDEIINVDRTPEEVFSEKTLASFENKPITVEHPDEDVTIDNYKDYAVGYVRDVKRGKTEDGQDVILGNLVITDKQTIEEIENGEHTDLSCGYDCDIQDEANPQQRNIRGNHVALCAQGRAGIAKIVDSVNDSPLEKVFENDEIVISKDLLNGKKVIYSLWLKNKGHLAPTTSYFNSIEEAKKKAKNYYGKMIDSIKDVEPRQGETKEEFLSRFMKETKEEYPDEKQRYAVANSYWNKQHDSIKDREFKHNIFGFINGTMQEFNPSELVEKVKQRRESLHTNRIVRDDDNYKCMYHIVVEVFGGYDLETCKVYVDAIKESWFRNTDYDADDYRNYQGKTYQDRVLSQNCGDGPDKWDKAIKILEQFKSKHLRDSLNDSDNLGDWMDELDYYSISYQFINGGYGMKFGDRGSYLKAKELAKKVNYTKGTWDDNKMTHFNFNSVMIGNDSINDRLDKYLTQEAKDLKELLGLYQNNSNRRPDGSEYNSGTGRKQNVNPWNKEITEAMNDALQMIVDGENLEKATYRLKQQLDTYNRLLSNLNDEDKRKMQKVLSRGKKILEKLQSYRDSINDSDDLRKLAEQYGVNYNDLVNQMQNLIRKGATKEHAMQIIKENLESIIMDSKNEFEDSIKDEPTWFKELAIEAKNYYKKQQKDVSWTDIANYVKSKTRGYGLMQISWWIEDFSKKNPDFLKDSVEAKDATMTCKVGADYDERDLPWFERKFKIKAEPIFKNGGIVAVKFTGTKEQLNKLFDYGYHAPIKDSIEDAEKYIYQFPRLTSRDVQEAKKYGLEFLGKVGKNGFQPGDYVIKGDLNNLKRYCDEYLGYEMHPDYLYKENNFDIDVLDCKDGCGRKEDSIKDEEIYIYVCDPEEEQDKIDKAKSLGAKINKIGGMVKIEAEISKMEKILNIKREALEKYADRPMSRIRKLGDSIPGDIKNVIKLVKHLKSDSKVKSKDEEDIEIGYYIKKEKGDFMPYNLCYEVHEINGDKVKFSEFIYENGKRDYAMKNGTTDIKNFKKRIKGYKKSDSYKY